MRTLDFESKNLLVGCVTLICLSYHVSAMPCNASSMQSCSASLYYVPESITTLQATASLFHVNASLVKDAADGFLITINCSCLAGHDKYTWRTNYLVQPGDSWDSISSKFGSFVVKKPQKSLFPSRTVRLDFLCGCSKNAYMITYRIKTGDTLYLICSRFKTDVTKTASLNGLLNPDLIHEGDILFIPETVRLNNLTVLGVDKKDTKAGKSPNSLLHILVGALTAAFITALLATVLVFWKRLRDVRARQSQGGSKTFSQRPDGLHCDLDACPWPTKSEEGTHSSSNSDKATVFPYNEILDATSNFDVTFKVGQGSCGSVYHAKLRGTDVAIKQMKRTKSKEFFSELNILCKVHHINLIAVDAAKGLEYIHERTKSCYVHRDVKTSNILLDSNFRAKVADFGLVKLLEHACDVRTMASRIVGTFGYLAPEYVRDGVVSTKSDVYSFGVVLMELITGQPALSKDESLEKDRHGEHRSVIQYMLSAVSDEGDSFTQLEKCIDPNLTRYHNESILQMALLSKDCVDDNWNRRPDMSRVVLLLSHILINSQDWEQQHCQHLMG